MSLSRARLAVKRAAAPTGTATAMTTTTSFAAANGVRSRRYSGVARPRPLLFERHLCLLRITNASREFCAPYTPTPEQLKGGRRWLNSTASEQQGPSSSNGISGDPAGAGSGANNSSNSNPLSTAGKLFFGSLCVGTFGLGCWQTSRLLEKQQLIEERMKELEQLPVSPSALEKDTIRPGSFQRLEMKGHYDHAREMLVGPRGAPSTGGGSSSYGGNMPSRQGYFVVSPFVTEEGDVYLVNRGWVPRNAVVPTMSPQQQHHFQQQQQRQRREQQEAARGGTGSRSSSTASNALPSPQPRLLQWFRPSGTTTVHALPSILEKPRFLVANHNYRERPVQLYWFDVDAMQQLVQRHDAVLVTAYNDDTEPKGEGQDDSSSLFEPIRPTLESLQEFKVSPAVHVAYAFTWFSLSLAGLIMTRRLATGPASVSAGSSAAAAAASAAAKSVR